MNLPARSLGKTGVNVTILGLGGEGILRTFGYEREASALINRALDLGITYFESARAYSGSESYYGTALKARRSEIFLTSKSHARDKKGAFAHLRETLRNMKTDYLDLWQVHDVREDSEIEEIFGRYGAIEAFREAREKGMVRFIGVTGHHDPLIIRKCIDLFEFDTVLIPVNPAEHTYKSFVDSVIPLAQERNMGVIAMKIYFRGLAAKLPGFDDLKPFFRFALSHPAATAVIGCDSIQQLEDNVRYASSFTPMTAGEMENLRSLISPNAHRLMYYKA